MRIAARIRSIRVERGLSIEDLTARTGLAKSLIAALEGGQAVPTLEMLEDLADAAEVPLHRFFFEEGELIRTPKLSTRVTWHELTEGCAPCTAPIRRLRAKAKLQV